MSFKPILLLQTGDTPEFIRERCGNFDAMFLAAAPFAETSCRTVHVARGERPEVPDRYRAAVVTGSHSMVTDAEEWSEWTAVWLREAVTSGLPVFGVCYGHQLLAHALGGRVGYHPAGKELGTFDITLTDQGRRDAFLAGFPECFAANLAHSQTVLELPEGAVVLAGSAHDPHQIVRYADNAVSVQFHPEFGNREMAAYLAFEAGPDSESAREAAKAAGAPWPQRLLERFVRDGCRAK